MRRIGIMIGCLLALPAAATELTWQTLPNMAMVTTPDVATANKNSVWSLAATLDGNTAASVWNGVSVTGKWRHCGSGDSVNLTAPAADCSGTDRWAATSGTFAAGVMVYAAAASLHSWYILESPAGLAANGVPYYLNIDYVAQTAPTLWVSKAKPAAVVQPCTTQGTTTILMPSTTGVVVGQTIATDGGCGSTSGNWITTVNTNVSVVINSGAPVAASCNCTMGGGARGRWTATDEFQTNTLALDATALPQQYRSHLSIASTGSFVWLTSRDGAGVFHTMISVLGLADTKTSDAFPVLSSVRSGTDYFDSSVVYATTNTQTKGRSFDGTVNVNYTLPIFYSSSGNLFGSWLSGLDAADSKYPDLPVYAFVNTASHISLRGRLPDIRFASYAIPNLSTASANGSAPYSHVVFGAPYSAAWPKFWMPWVASVAPTP